MTLFFIVVIMLMRVVQSVYNKRTAIFLPDGIKSYIAYIAVFNLFAAAFSAVSLITDGGFGAVDLKTVIIASCSGAFLALGSYCSIKSLTGGTVALNSVFETAGLIVPCILGIYFFNEPVGIVGFLCIIGVLASAAMLINSSKSLTGVFTAKTLFYLIVSMLSNGMVMFCQKLFGMYVVDGNVSMFSLLTFLIPSIVMGIMLLFMRADDKEQIKLPKKLILYAVYLSFAVFIIQQFVTLLTPHLSSTVLFTVVNGGATVIAAIVGAVLYKEKITPKSALGIILGISALIMINAC